MRIIFCICHLRQHLEVCIQQVRQSPPVSIHGDPLWVMGIEIHALGGGGNHLSFFQQQRQRVNVLEELAHGKPYLCEQFPAENLVASIRVHIRLSVEPIRSHITVFLIVEDQLVFIVHQREMLKHGIFQDVILRMNIHQSHHLLQRIVAQVVVAIHKRDVLPFRMVYSHVACIAQPTILLMYHPYLIVVFHVFVADIRTTVRRTIIHQYHLPISERLRENTVDATPDGLLNLIYGYDN